MKPNTLLLKRSQDARASFGNCPASTWYEWIERRVMTPGIPISTRSVAWPDHELQAIAAARIAGKSEEEIKRLVQDLMAARSTLADRVAA